MILRMNRSLSRTGKSVFDIFPVPLQTSIALHDAGKVLMLKERTLRWLRHMHNSSNTKIEGGAGL